MAPVASRTTAPSSHRQVALDGEQTPSLFRTLTQIRESVSPRVYLASSSSASVECAYAAPARISAATQTASMISSSLLPLRRAKRV